MLINNKKKKKRVVKGATLLYNSYRVDPEHRVGHNNNECVLNAMIILIIVYEKRL